MKYVLIRSNTSKPFCRSAISLLETLIQEGYPLKVDTLSFQKIRIMWDIEVEVLENGANTNTALPMIISVYTSSTLHYDLINNPDYKWFLRHLKLHRIPESRYAVELASRNQKLIAFLSSQKKITEMQKSKP